MANTKSVFETLSGVAIKEKVERKNNMDYLSWAYAWSLLKQNYPSAQRIVYEDQSTGWNYFTDGRTAWVKVGIVVEGLEHIDYLPIMDFRNQAIPIEKVNQFEVNKSIQRSTAKAIAMHGLGLQLWTGEDLPSEVITTQPSVTKEKQSSQVSLMTLKVDDENWGKVLNYISQNPQLDLVKIGKQLSRKYSMDAETKKAISLFHKSVSNKNG